MQDFRNWVEVFEAWNLLQNRNVACGKVEIYLPLLFPGELGERRYYHPPARGLEIKIAEKLAHLRDLDRKSGK